MEGVSWLEVSDARGALVTRARLDRFPFVLGRGYSGDLVLDDPQLSAAHARISVDPDGAIVVEDLDSENGIWTAAGERVRRTPVRSGDTLRAGRLTLRFLAADHPVAPTQRSDGSAPAVPERRPGARAALILGAAATALVTAQGYIGSYARTDPGAQLAEAAGYALLIAAYAGIWAFVGRVTVQRFSFGGHVAVASAAVLAFGGVSVISEYVSFLLPDQDAVEGLVGLVMLVLGAALVHRQLELATALRPRVRWALAAGVVGLIVVLSVAGEWEEEFSSYPEFSAVVKPVGAGLARRTSVEDFVQGADALAAEVDSLALKPVR